MYAKTHGQCNLFNVKSLSTVSYLICHLAYKYAVMHS